MVVIIVVHTALCLLYVVVRGVAVLHRWLNMWGARRVRAIRRLCLLASTWGIITRMRIASWILVTSLWHCYGIRLLLVFVSLHWSRRIFVWSGWSCGKIHACVVTYIYPCRAGQTLFCGVWLVATIVHVIERSS